MNIYGEKVLLRAMELEDMEMLRETTNDPETEHLIGGWSFPIGKKSQQQWFERAVSDRDNLRLTIEIIETGEAIGMENLVDIDWKNRSAFTGIRLGTKAPKGCGYAKDAVMALMRYAFEELQLVRLDGSWVEYNVSSLKLYQKCGWSVEGIKKNAKFSRGSFYDVLFGGILAPDYFRAKEQMKWTPFDEK